MASTRLQMPSTRLQMPSTGWGDGVHDLQEGVDGMG
jgi:hypothetical protein